MSLTLRTILWSLASATGFVLVGLGLAFLLTALPFSNDHQTAGLVVLAIWAFAGPIIAGCVSQLKVRHPRPALPGLLTGIIAILQMAAAIALAQSHRHGPPIDPRPTWSWFAAYAQIVILLAAGAGWVVGAPPSAPPNEAQLATGRREDVVARELAMSHSKGLCALLLAASIACFAVTVLRHGWLAPAEVAYSLLVIMPLAFACAVMECRLALELMAEAPGVYADRVRWPGSDFGPHSAEATQLEALLVMPGVVGIIIVPLLVLGATGQMEFLIDMDWSGAVSFMLLGLCCTWAPFGWRWYTHGREGLRAAGLDPLEVMREEGYVWVRVLGWVRRRRRQVPT